MAWAAVSGDAAASASALDWVAAAAGVSMPPAREETRKREVRRIALRDGMLVNLLDVFFFMLIAFVRLFLTTLVKHPNYY